MKVYRALSIPNLCSNTYVEEYDTESFCNVWRDIVIGTLREATRLFAEFLQKLPREHRGKINIAERIRFLVDIYTWLLKSPAYLDPVKKTIYSPYKIYVYERIRRMLGFKLGDIIGNFIEMITKYCEKTNEPECVLAEELTSLADTMRSKLEEHGDDWRIILQYPADTRPGYNSTSLIVHSILVSALAWSIASAKGYTEYKAELYALVGILHDIDKPCNPEHHVKESKEIVSKELGKSLKEIIGDENYKELISIIEKHHSGDEILRRADKLAARERNTLLVEHILYEKKVADDKSLLEKTIEEVFEKLSSSDREKFKAIRENPMNLYEVTGISRELVWEFWKKMGDEKVKELTKVFAKETWGIRLQKNLEEIKEKREEENREAISPIVLLVDISGVQRIINDSLDLRIMAVNSYLIDTWLMSELPNSLGEKYSVPLSAFIINSGGNSLIILPPQTARKIEEKIKHELNTLNYALLKLTINTALEVFDPDYTRLYPELANKLVIAKRTRMIDGGFIHPGISNSFCELCGVRPAQATIRIGGNIKHVCFECLVRHNIASGIVYAKAKKKFFDEYPEIYDSERKLAAGSSNAGGGNDEIYYQVFNNLIEYISGLPPVEKYHGRKLNYSVISIDGNIMGYYVSQSPTFTSAIEKSLLIDYALKKAYSEFIDKVIDSLSREFNKDIGYREASRLVLGYLYMGGDDAKLITPSYIAVPLTIYIVERFHELTNCTMTLSIGIASGPVKHSIWGLNNASIGLMNDFAKPDGRKATLEALNGKKPTYSATLQLYTTESTSMLTSQRVSEFYRQHLSGSGSPGLVLERYTVSRNNVGRLDNLYRILNLITGYLDSNDNNGDLVEKLITLGYKLIINQCSNLDKQYKSKCLEYYLAQKTTNTPDNIEEKLTRLKRLRDAVNEALSIYEKFKDTGDPTSLVIVYLKRQAARHSGKAKNEYDALLDIILKGSINMKTLSTPLLSILLLLKTISGGVM